jgi:hypothetical protein
MTKAEKEIADEAYMMGRVYEAGGAKDSPATAYEKLHVVCERISKKHHITGFIRKLLRNFR